MTAVERKLRALLKTVLDECEGNPAFRERLAAVLDGAEELESHRAPKSSRAADGPSDATSARTNTTDKARSSAGAKRLGRRPPGPFDPFAVYQAGEDRDPLKEHHGELGGEVALRQQLGKLDEDALKDIIAEHSMDTSRLAMKWKDPDRLIDLIVKTVVQRSRKGEAFINPEFRVKASDAVYVNDWQAIIVGIEISNRGPADTITAIELRIGDQTFSHSMPDASKSIPKLISEAPRRIEHNDGLEGALYFGPSLDGGASLPKAPEAELIVRRASGAAHRSQVTVRSRERSG